LAGFQVSTEAVALSTGDESVLVWLENQTGVAYATLKKHYALWLPKPDRGMWEKMDPPLKTRTRGAA